MSVRIVCVVCGVESGAPDATPVDSVWGHLSCIALTTDTVTSFTVTSLFDKAARRSVYVQNLSPEDSDDDVRLAISRYQRARKRAMYAAEVCKENDRSRSQEDL